MQLLASSGYLPIVRDWGRRVIETLTDLSHTWVPCWWARECLICVEHPESGGHHGTGSQHYLWRLKLETEGWRLVLAPGSSGEESCSSLMLTSRDPQAATDVGRHHPKSWVSCLPALQSETGSPRMLWNTNSHKLTTMNLLLPLINNYGSIFLSLSTSVMISIKKT